MNNTKRNTAFNNNQILLYHAFILNDTILEFIIHVPYFPL